MEKKEGREGGKLQRLREQSGVLGGGDESVSDTVKLR